MSNTNTATALSTETTRATAAAEAYLNSEFRGSYDEPAGSDEYDTWPEVIWEIETSEMGSHPSKVLVECEVVACSGGHPGSSYFVTVELKDDLSPVKHDLDAQIEAECEQASADVYTRRAEEGFRDA